MVDPDYSAFKLLLKEAIERHYAGLAQSLAGDRCIGYCLYTNDEVSSVGPVSNRAGALKKGTADPEYRYYRYSADEWSEWNDFGAFADVNAWIARHSGRQDYFKHVAPKLLALCADALFEQKRGGMFGDSEDLFLVVWVSDSDRTIIRESAARLNSPAVFREFAQEFC